MSNHFIWTFCPVQLTSLHFILNNEPGFYKSTIIKVHSSACGITAHSTVPITIIILDRCFDPEALNRVQAFNLQPLSY